MSTSTYSSNKKKNIPMTLKNHPFHGLTLDEDQVKFRDAIWDPDKLIIFVDACAGSGKTTIAVGTADILVEYGRYNGIVYVCAPTQEQKQGYLSGSLEEKSEPYFEPLYQALTALNIRPSSVTRSNDDRKNGNSYIECVTHTFLRGTNFDNKVIIIDEAANFYLDELKKVLTRIHDNCKVIVIGHHGQVDLYKNPERSGFTRYIEWFRDDPRCEVCTLSTNHRGWISKHADDLPIQY